MLDEENKTTFTISQHLILFPDKLVGTEDKEMPERCQNKKPAALLLQLKSLYHMSEIRRHLLVNKVRTFSTHKCTVVV